MVSIRLAGLLSSGGRVLDAKPLLKYIHIQGPGHDLFYIQNFSYLATMRREK